MNSPLPGFRLIAPIRDNYTMTEWGPGFCAGLLTLPSCFHLRLVESQGVSRTEQFRPFIFPFARIMVDETSTSSLSFRFSELSQPI